MLVPVLSSVGGMLGIAAEKMKPMMICTYSVTRGERLYKNFDLDGAEDNRDALAKVSLLLFIELND